jgi:hypothetical protein
MIHSAHISKETKAWLAEQPVGRFEFTFTPKHGSWLNLVEGFFSKLARSVLRHIRVASKQELKDRIMDAMDFKIDVLDHCQVMTDDNLSYEIFSCGSLPGRVADGRGTDV